MSVLYAMLAFVAVQRAVELVIATRNTRALLARGAREVAPEQYPYFIGLHAAWLASMFFFIPRDTPPFWPLIIFFFALQAARVWVLATLREYWTTRIITLPGAPLVRSGPYRFARHPNYLIVALEIAVLPVAFRAYTIAIVFSLLNAALLFWRMQAENRVLEERGPAGGR